MKKEIPLTEKLGKKTQSVNEILPLYIILKKKKKNSGPFVLVMNQVQSLLENEFFEAKLLILDMQ